MGGKGREGERERGMNRNIYIERVRRRRVVKRNKKARNGGRDNEMCMEGEIRGTEGQG